MGRSKKNASDQPADVSANQGATQEEQSASESASTSESADVEASDRGRSKSAGSKTGRSRKTARKSTAKQAADPADPTWSTTEELLKTLNQELGGLKEYVLADLRGEITSLRSRKLQLETEVKRLESDRDQLLAQRERGLTEQEQAQQQQWAQQFSQVMAQNLRQELQAQLLEGRETGKAARPEQRLLMFREQIAGMEAALVQTIKGMRQELGRHESDLSQQMLRMQDLERQGEMLLEQLLQRLQHSALSKPAPASEFASVARNDGESDLSPISFTLGSTSTTGIAASLRARTEVGPVPEPGGAVDAGFPASDIDGDAADSSTSDAASGSMPAAIGADSTTISEFPADVLFGRAPTQPSTAKIEASETPGGPESPQPPVPPPFPLPQPTPPDTNTATDAATDTAAPSAQAIPPFDAERVMSPAPLEASGADDQAEAAAVEPDPFGETEFLPEPEALFADPPFADPQNEDETPESASGIVLPRMMHASQLPGFMSAALSLLLLSLQYSTVHLIFHGVPWVGGAASGFMPSSWASALLTFWIRMLMVLPFMIVIGQGIYPPLLEEMQELFRTRDRRPLISIVLSSFLLFLSQFLLYRAIGESSASVAVGLLFVYPAAVNIFGVGLFRRRIAQSTLLTLLPIGLGGMILLFQSGSGGGINPGIISAICFALYALVGRLYTRRLNVLTLTVMQFGMAWLFSMPALFFLRSASPSNSAGYVVACLVLSLTVFLSYFFNTASLNRVGPAWTSVINGWTPLLVALIGLIIDPGNLTVAQGLGVLLVTLGVTALNLERLRR